MFNTISCTIEEVMKEYGSINASLRYTFSKTAWFSFSWKFRFSRLLAHFMLPQKKRDIKTTDCITGGETGDEGSQVLCEFEISLNTAARQGHNNRDSCDWPACCYEVVPRPRSNPTKTILIAFYSMQQLPKLCCECKQASGRQQQPEKGYYYF